MRSPLLCSLLAATATFAGTSMPGTPGTATAGDFVLEAGTVEIRELLDSAADYLGRNYIYSEADIANAMSSQVTLQHTLTLDAIGCEEVVSQLAYTMGFAMIPVDTERGIYEWVYRQGPKRIELSTRPFQLSPDEVIRKQNLHVQALTCLPLHTMEPSYAMNQLRPFFTTSNSDSALRFGAAGTGLLIQGYAPQVASAVKILRMLDGSVPARPDWQREVEARLEALENGD